MLDHNKRDQESATIQKGEFATATLGGKVYGGGPAVIRVTGLTAPGGQLLCVEEFIVDLPRSDASHDVDVTAKAGVKLPKGSGP